jgi:Ca-activated chloride channel family protein
MAQVTLKGLISGQKKTYQTRFSFPATITENPEIERLWAYATIEEMRQEMDDFGEQADLKQAVVDLGIEYSLVTDYTSMVVMRDEIFEQRGIERRNRARIKVEQEAQEHRAQRPPQSRRADTQQPMYQSDRSDLRSKSSSSGSSSGGSSGGGSLDVWYLLFLIPLMLVYWQRKKVE